jgi:hypothetical protein
MAEKQQDKRTTAAEACEAALTWVNEQRAHRDMCPLSRLPHGQRGISEDCPIARALGGRVDGSDWHAPDGAVVELPHEVERFTLAFDMGALPALATS